MAELKCAELGAFNMMWLDDVRFRRQLARLQKAKSKTIDAYQDDIEKARNAKDWDQEQYHASGMFHEVDMIDDEISALQHKYVTRQAEQLLIPLPKFNTKSSEWRCSEIDGRWRLADEMLFDVARTVRRERRERVELAFLFPAAFIGVVGGVVGIATAFF